MKKNLRSEDESANEYESCPSPSEEIDSNSGWQEVIRYLRNSLSYLLII